MRRRARHRLIGAAVLLILGVVGFPLLFDTQPRPIPVDIPIAIPDRDRAPALVLPGPVDSAQKSANGAGAISTPNATNEDGGAPGSATKNGPARAPSGLDANEEFVASAGPAVDRGGPPSSSPPVADTSAKKDPAVKESAVSATQAERKPAPESSRSAAPAASAAVPVAPVKSVNAAAARAADAARAKALLEGRPPPAALPSGVVVASVAPASPAASEGARYVVQVGAFAELEKAQDVRRKLEQSGLKTYVQSVDTGQGKRYRVRVGPFANRVDADRSAGRVKTLSLPASVLTL